MADVAGFQRRLQEYERSPPDLQKLETAFKWGYVTLAAMGASYVSVDVSEEFDLPQQCHHAKVIKYLVGKGAPVDCADVAGFTPLHFAVRNRESIPEVDTLLIKGADSGRQNRYGETPLHLACYTKNSEALLLIFEHPVDLSLIDSEGFTPADLLQTFTGDIFDQYEYWKQGVRKFGIFGVEMSICGICNKMKRVWRCRKCFIVKICSGKCPGK